MRLIFDPQAPREYSRGFVEVYDLEKYERGEEILRKVEYTVLAYGYDDNNFRVCIHSNIDNLDKTEIEYAIRDQEGLKNSQIFDYEYDHDLEKILEKFRYGQKH